MQALKLSVGLLAAAVAFSAQTAQAADLDYGPPSGHSAYEDPRYRDLYGRAESRTTYERRTYEATPPPSIYIEQEPRRYVDNGPRSYKDDGYRGDRRSKDYGRYDDDDDRSGSARRYGSAEPNFGPAAGCLPREEIRRRLVSEGWRGFQDVDLHRNVALIRARRGPGDLFELKVDRCSGDVVRAVRVEGRGPGPYAYDNGPRTYERRSY